jgi:hypothetical protein
MQTPSHPPCSSPSSALAGPRPRRLLPAVAVYGFLAVAGLAGCSPGTPAGSDGPDGPIGQADQHLTECVTFERGGTGNVADATIDLAQVSTNYGAQVDLIVQKRMQSLLSVDLSSIPSYAIVNSATLTTYVFGGNTDTRPVNFHQALAPWSESSVTYASFNEQYSPTISGSFTPPAKNGAFKSVDLTALTTRWVAGTTPNYGVLLETTPQNATGECDFASSEFGTPYEPSLLVCYQLPDNHCGPPNPCENGGSCVNGWSGYTCACAPGFAGANCQNDMNECAQSPCLNGGTCTDGVNSYACACAPGYTGQNCQTLVDNCASGPCQNGGICQNGVNSYACACPAGFTGSTCQTPNACALNPCVNGACTDAGSGYTCACQAGYTGTNCDVLVDNCPGNACANGSLCVNGLNGYTCACLPGYGGALCQNDLQDCEQQQPCLHGGACTDGVNSYTCACAPGYTGQNCEVDIDECASQPCQNGGMCVDGVNSYACQCSAGFWGVSCQNAGACESGDPCNSDTPNPIDGDPQGVSCTDTANGGFTCQCSPSGTGATCTANGPYLLPAGALSWYKAEGNFLDTLGANDGAASGLVGFAPGEVGSAFLFDGTSNGNNVTATSNGFPTGNADRTVEGWVRFDDVNRHPYQAVFAYGAPNGGAEFGVALQQGQLLVDFQYGAVVGPVLTQGQLYHFAAEYSGGVVSLYVNGALAAQGAIGIYTTPGTPLTIGQSPNAVPTWGDSEMVGLVDELTFYGRALSPAEIQGIYAAGMFGKTRCATTTATTALRLTDFSRAACGPDVSSFPSEGSVTVTDPGCGSTTMSLHFATVGGQRNATYIAAVTCVTFLGTYTTDANGNGSGDFTFQGSPGQVVGFDTQVTTDGTGNGIVYYTSAQSDVLALP